MRKGLQIWKIVKGKIPANSRVSLLTQAVLAMNQVTSDGVNVLFSAGFTPLVMNADS